MDLQYPIGKHDWPTPVSAQMRAQYIEEITAAPALMRDAVRGLNDRQLDTPYRDGGWTVRQVVHHVPDSHMNSFIRMRLALTEHEPTIKPYDEAAWARLPDSEKQPVEPSLTLLESLHARWVWMLRGLSQADFGRTFRHPEIGLMSIESALGLYAWHGKHHTAHIQGLRQRMGWK